MLDKSKILIVSEFNDRGVLFHFPDYFGAFTRGVSETEAYEKIHQELKNFRTWAAISEGNEEFIVNITRVKASDNLRIDDADSEILLDHDCKRLSKATFDFWSELAIRSGECFVKLYESIADKDKPQLEKERTTFYGKTPSTAREMLLHVDQVHDFYLSRINLYADFQKGELNANRHIAIAALRKNLQNPFKIYSQDSENWTETKVLRRLLWHDRIHAKALFRHSLKIGLSEKPKCDPFLFL